MVDLAGTRSLGSAALEVAHDKPRPTRAIELRADDDRCPSLEAQEKNCADDTKTIDQLQKIMHGIHERLAEQEERLNTLRTELQSQLYDLDEHRASHAAKLELVGSQIQGHEEALKLYERGIISLLAAHTANASTQGRRGLLTRAIGDLAGKHTRVPVAFKAAHDEHEAAF